MQTNHFAILQTAIIDVGMRNDATNLIFKAQVKMRTCRFQDFSDWITDKRNEKSISALIAFALKDAKKSKKKLQIN